MPRLILLRGVPGAGKSVTAKLMSAFQGDLAVVEVDDVKRENPANKGVATHCQPATDFPEAGRRARVWLGKSYHVLVVEYFNCQEHLEYVVEAADRMLDGADVSVIWLDCSWDKVLARKLDKHPRDVLEKQYERKSNRYKHNGEIEIDTSCRLPDEVARELLSKLGLEEERDVP